MASALDHIEKTFSEFDAQRELKRAMAEDYAVVTVHDRAINQGGVAFRKIAGLLILLSMLMTLFVFGRIVLYRLS